jgi:Ribbon-helix-helix domain
MYKMNLYVTQQQRDALDKLSKKTGLAVAELIRRFIDAGLKAGK